VREEVDRRWKIYDYPRFAHDYTHPARLFTTATWFGLTPPALETARVLELGCATGDNLIGMAVRLPGARFDGVDLNEKAVATGQAWVEELGLENVTLRADDILAVPVSGEPYDYIIVHGIYSWVPDDVRAHILAVIKGRLAPEGIAYVSYNALPGWRVWGVFREIMQERFGHLPNPIDQAERAFEFIEWMRLGQGTEDDWWGAIVEVERQRMMMGGPVSVAHDQLSPLNVPFWVKEFVRHANAAGLTFLAEAQLRDSWLQDRSAEVTDLIDGVVDPVEREQLIDYVAGRTFRRTLLVHPHQRPTRPDSADVAIDGMYLSTSLSPPADLDLKPDVPAIFKDHGSGFQVTLENSLSKAAFAALNDLDQPRWDEWLAAVPERLGEALTPMQSVLLRHWAWDWLRSGAIEARSHRVGRSLTPSERPVIEPYVRTSVAQRLPAVNLFHEVVAVDDVDRVLMPLCDGEHDLFDLARALSSRLTLGPLEGLVADKPVPTEPTERMALASALVRARLKRYATSSFLVA
jgi:SAM-dependent methyltransferase